MRIVLLMLVLASASLALADSVKLKNGATFKGRVVREDSQQVVIKTSGGKLTFPLANVAEVVRESPQANLLEEGRVALRKGKRERARTLFAKAKQGKDAKVQRLATRELERLAAQPAPHVVKAEAKPKFSMDEDPFDLPEGEALFRDLEGDAKTSVPARRELVVRLARRGFERMKLRDLKSLTPAVADLRRAVSHARRVTKPDPSIARLRGAELTARLLLARRALSKRKGNLALAATHECARAQDLPKGLVRATGYLHGRALEMGNHRREAEASYRRAISLDLGPRGHLATYRELARLASVGVQIDEHSPGVGKGWTWVRTRHFAILHKLKPNPMLSRAFESYYSAVVKRLSLRNKLTQTEERIPVFIYDSEEAYKRSAGARHWSGGHASRVQSHFDEEEVVRAIYFYPSARFEDTARHEIAHILMWDALDNALLPSWASEGAALYAETDGSRKQRVQIAQRYQKQLKDPLAYLERMRLPNSEDSNEISLFYIQSGVSFELLADGLGLEKTIGVAEKINKQGPEKALRSAGWSGKTFSTRMRERLGARN